VTAEKLYEEATRAKVPVSLATVYNTLHQFTDIGLLRQISIDCSKAYFPHQQFRSPSLLDALPSQDYRKAIESVPLWKLTYMIGRQTPNSMSRRSTGRSARQQDGLSAFCHAGLTPAFFRNGRYA
jgi:hypothetical protein